MLEEGDAFLDELVLRVLEHAPQLSGALLAHFGVELFFSNATHNYYGGTYNGREYKPYPNTQLD